MEEDLDNKVYGIHHHQQEILFSFSFFFGRPSNNKNENKNKNKIQGKTFLLIALLGD